MNKIIVVGAGLFGSVCAYELNKAGYPVEVVDERNHVGGNCYTEKQHGITVHKYGSHIFHTKDETIWKYINNFGKFNNYVHKTFVKYGDRFYSIPFNLLTYQDVFVDYGLPLTEERTKKLFEMFIRNYSEKQWGRRFEDIPVEYVARLPTKSTFNNDYFENEYQGIPIEGYTSLIEQMLKGVDVRLNTKFTLDEYNGEQVIYTGMIDDLLNFQLGRLEYRSLVFEVNYFPDIDDYQGNSIINYPEKRYAYTRVLEYKHFDYNKCKGTIIAKEYPTNEGVVCYPINDSNNNKLYDDYLNLLNSKYPKIAVGGRLGSYRYFNMDVTISRALRLVKDIS